ncbi:MAG: hypothetical protein GKR92_01415 [Gammaproteobacteria bacterium]|nr:MAG: hypothetical protein GKR92_01415 [Gammaproteobacteria bacterium]
MVKCDSEIIKIGIVGEGSLANLLIMKLLDADIFVNLLASNNNQNLDKPTVYFHNSLSALVRSSSIIITITPDGPALEQVLFSKQGVVNCIASDTIIVDMSSVSPEFIKEISEQLIEKEIQFLDAALINEERCESGLIQMMLIGGERHTYEKVMPIFKQIVSTMKHLGENGASQFYRQAFGVRAKRE